MRHNRAVGDWLRLALPIVLIAVFGVVAWKAGYFKLKNAATLNAAADRARDIPWLGVAFTAVYAVMAASAAPISPMAYAAGAIFGIARGAVAIWSASMIGGIAGYWLARGFLAGSAARLLGRHEAKLRELRKDDAFLIMLRMQLFPVVPFGVCNYAAGAAKVRFRAYVAATAIGIIPGTLAAVVVGDRIAEGFRGSGRGAFVVAGVVAGALIALSFLPTLIAGSRRIRRQRAQ